MHRRTCYIASQSPEEADSFQTPFDALPPELQVTIYTFSAGSRVQHITTSYKSPSSLQVSQETRDKFSKLHYNLTRFKATGQVDLKQWLCSLQAQHHAQIRSIRFDLTEHMASDVKSKKPHSRKHQQQPSSKGSRKRKQRQVKHTRDEHFGKIKHAEERPLFVRAYIMKRTIRLRKEALKSMCHLLVWRKRYGLMRLRPHTRSVSAPLVGKMRDLREDFHCMISRFQ